ncbi:MAG: alpha-L-fucosidase, partial [Candidatus Sumerlaeota bacterium]|nr:alpha-L-fucosidase [Candidatus Sumerlaeota bacterium]
MLRQWKVLAAAFGFGLAGLLMFAPVACSAAKPKMSAAAPKSMPSETAAKSSEPAAKPSDPAVKPAAPAAPAAPAETPDHEARIKWFREAKFGLFIHWGLYAIPAGEWKGQPVAGIGEWIMNRAKIPVKEYEQLAAQFNPVKFNAEEWVQMAEDAGMKYIVITSKHHDGFAMFHSDVSKYNVVDATPFHRDPMKELSAACAKRGLKFVLFFCESFLFIV